MLLGCTAFEDGTKLTHSLKLFACHGVLFDPRVEGREKSCNAFEPGIHSFPFSLEIPLLSTCNSTPSSGTRNIQSALPPSLDLVSNSLKISATYQLGAVVERPGMLRRKITRVQKIEFRPLYPPRLTSLAQPSRTKIVGHLSATSLGIQEKASSQFNELPPYSPSIVFEATLPIAKIIRPSEHVDLGITIVVPIDLAQALYKLWLDSLLIRLKTTTTAVVACHARSHVGYVNVCSIKGFLPLDVTAGHEKCQIPPGLWQNHVYPTMLPSFRSCGIQRTHQLEIIAGLVSNSADKIHVRNIHIDKDP